MFLFWSFCPRYNHFSHPFLGTYEVIQFFELANFEGTPFQSPYHSIIPWYGCHIPFHVIPYHSMSYHTKPFHTIPSYHTIPSFQTCHKVAGVLFLKYENYFCRLQYWSIGLHFLWTSSSHFFWHCKLQVKATGWTWSFENQLDWALSQVLAIHTLYGRLKYWSIGPHFWGLVLHISSEILSFKWRL